MNPAGRIAATAGPACHSTKSGRSTLSPCTETATTLVRDGSAHIVVARKPSMPVYIYHAQYDEILPNAGVDRLVDKYCAEGAPSVVYERELVAEHITGVAGQLPGVFHWPRDRLDGVPAPEGGTITDPVLVMAEPRFWQTLGEIVPTAVQALIGQAIGAGR
ncbi:lipase family protein [Nocardia sp. NPDC059228]|uniref:lipase family protein n=1 Tax=Nocardia sp. NPDC059228 TaxID=3346777 RepID=UPI0036CEBD8F